MEAVISYCKDVSNSGTRLVVVPDIIGGELMMVRIKYERRDYCLSKLESELGRALNDAHVASKGTLTATVTSPAESGVIVLLVNDQVIQFSAKLVKNGINHLVTFLNNHRTNGEANA